MIDKIVSQLNWVDAVIITVFLRVVYLGFRKGFMVEAFKLLGTFFAIFVSLHYCGKTSEFISTHSPMPIDFAYFISLLSLSVIVLVLFKFLRDGLLTLMKVQPLELLDKWGSFVLGLIRGLFVTSLISLIIFLSTIGYFQKSVDSSFSGRYLLELSPRTYAFIFENIVSKFFPEEKLNLIIFKAVEKRGWFYSCGFGSSFLSLLLFNLKNKSS